MVLSGCLISISEVDTMVISDTDKKLLASFLMVSSAAHENFPNDYYNETWKSEKLPGYSLIVKFNNIGKKTFAIYFEDCLIGEHNLLTCTPSWIVNTLRDNILDNILERKN